MNINITQNNKTIIVQISTDIDHHYAALIKEKVDKELNKTNAKNIIFDLSAVNFMDSSGIGMIIGRFKLIQNKGGKVYAVSINAQLQRIFEISGLLKLINIAKNVDQALVEI